MKITAILAFALAAFAMASPVPEAEAEAGLAEAITGSLPHPVGGVDKIMTSVEPVNLVTRQAANATANAAAKKAKKAKKGMQIP
jgi:hypothetical protein